MTVEQTIQAVPAMSLNDRLRLAEAIWDSLEEHELPPTTASQQQELQRRMAEHDADPQSALTPAQFQARLKELR